MRLEKLEITETSMQVKKDSLEIGRGTIPYPMKTLYTFICVCPFKFSIDNLHGSKIKSTKGLTMNNPPSLPINQAI